MPPKQRITKEMILEKAFEMFCCEGMDAINARSVAKALNCSTQPIFSYYSGMEDLKKTLEQKAKALFTQMLHVEADEENPMVGLACAYTHFAVEQPQLYLHLCRMDDLLFPFESEVERAAVLQHGAQRSGLPAEQAAHVHAQLSMYVLGLATARASGKVTYTTEQMHEMIDDLYSVLLKAS